MAKGNGGTRTAMPSSLQKEIDGYIQAYTAKGGPDYSLWSQFDTEENRQKMMTWMDKQPKVSGENLYRGSWMLSGDIVNNLVFGGWKEGETIVTPEIISGNPAGLLSFTKNSTAVFSYEGFKPKPKATYDKFENEPMRVKFVVQTSGKNFVDITKKSHYSSENESVAKASSTRFVFAGARYVNDYWEVNLKEKKK